LARPVEAKPTVKRHSSIKR